MSDRTPLPLGADGIKVNVPEAGEWTGLTLPLPKSPAEWLAWMKAKGVDGRSSEAVWNLICWMEVQEEAIRAYFVAAGFQDVDELMERFNTSFAAAFPTELGEAVAESTTELAKSRDDLLEELEARFAQTKCGCGHPACKRCKDDAMTQAVIDRARGRG